MSQLATTLFRATAATFEELAFQLPLPPGTPVRPEPQTVAAVDFHGPFAGRVEVGVSERLLPAVAANMLGQEDPPAAAEQRDALRELANVICGNLLPQIAGAGPVFRLDAPRIDAAPPAQPLVAQAEVAFDEGAATVRLFAERGALS